MSVQKLRVGIVGCGEVTQIIHLPALHQLGDRFEVTALCDVSRVVLDGVGDQWGVASRYLEYDGLIDDANVDAVLVANPHAYHADVVLTAIDAGKHVLVEKPMCMTFREADAIIDACERTGVTVQVGYMRRYAPAFVQACTLVQDLPKITLARVHDVIGQNALIVDRTSKVIRGTDIAPLLVTRAKARQDALVAEAIGDAPLALQNAYLVLLALSSHDLSAMRELLGMPQRVLHASMRQAGTYITAAFDYGEYVCQFETGIDSIPRFDGYIEVYGPEDVIRVQYDTPYVRHLPITLHVTKANDQGGVSTQVTHPTWGDPFVVAWHAFYDNVTQRLRPKTDPEDFRRDLELFERMVVHMRAPEA